jgi:hypothetical protein
MNLQKLIILMISIILLLIIIEIIRLNTIKKCPKSHIEYRYIPRSFKETQEEPIPINDIFDKMFTKRSPWMMGRNIGTNNIRVINKTRNY